MLQSRSKWLRIQTAHYVTFITRLLNEDWVTFIYEYDFVTILKNSVELH
jgi:hypothetical protein